MARLDGADAKKYRFAALGAEGPSPAKRRFLAAGRVAVPFMAWSSDGMVLRWHGPQMAWSRLVEATLADYQSGDRVRVVRVPPSLYRDDPVYRETARFFELCLGQVFRVQGFDKYGQLELWVTDDGRQAPGRLPPHTIWIEPEYVEPSV